MLAAAWAGGRHVVAATAVSGARRGLLATSSVPVRGVWGNVNKCPPRGRNRPNKHHDPRFRKLRGAKVLKLDLPDGEVERKLASFKMSPDESRAEMKRLGMLPPHPDGGTGGELPVFMASTGAVFHQYVPPEADGQASILSSEGAKQRVTAITTRGSTFKAVRKVRSFDDDFDPRGFAEDLAQEIYVKAHKALSQKDEESMHELVTEKAFPEMTFNTKFKSIYWSFVKSLEPPQVVHVRTQEVVSKSNVFAQVTVRFNSQQILAVYDRFGRLIHGHPHVAKDVLEYVVFEKHLSNLYGKWRLHAKIIPDWLQARRGGGLLTQVLPKEDNAAESKTADSAEPPSKEDDPEAANALYDRFGKRIESQSSSSASGASL